MSEDEPEADYEAEPDPAITPEVFRKWRAPRRGAAHPEPMDNPFWEWMVRTRISAYLATEKLGGPASIDAGPGWCFDRFGQGIVTLPDGRKVFVAGEHEDHYDPDFFIYNDVTILHPDGRIEILGYPEDDFPPTDFHSASLVGDAILLIGNLGYPEERQAGHTPVHALDTRTWKISRQDTSGDPPGWIHRHAAVVSEDARRIMVSGGLVWRGDDGPMLENIDDWSLELETGLWKRLTARRWPRWEFRREDGEPNGIWNMRTAVMNKKIGLPMETDLGKNLDLKALGVDLDDLDFLKVKYELPEDPELLENLYRPDVPHEALPERQDQHNVHRFRIEGIVVRFLEESHHVMMTVEGELQEATERELVDTMQERLSRLEGCPYTAIRH